jgi:hypothetical protein
MAITTLAQLRAALPGQRFDHGRGTGLPSMAGGQFSSPNLAIGGSYGSPAAPSSGLSGAVVTDASGYVPFASHPSGNQLGRFQVIAQNAVGNGGMMYLYDRLWENSGIDRTLITAQTINSVALNRPDANGDQAEPWWQVYVAMGTGTPTVTLSYTNESGASGRGATSGAFSASLGIGRTGPFALTSPGDYGVRSIQTWQSTATFGTIGTIGLVLRRRLAMVSAYNHLRRTYDDADAIRLGMARVYPSAALEFVYLSGTGAGHTYAVTLWIVGG